MTSANQLPLPRHWPRRVKSALVNAVALAHYGITHVRGWCADSRIARVRLAAQNEQLRAENALLRDMMRIKDARMARCPAAQRPHYMPTERLEILEIKAAQRWTSAEAAEAFLITPATTSSWVGRVDEQGPDALVRTPEPVNRFPDLTRHLVQRLKTLCPAMGKARIAHVLARAALHLSASTARRILKEKPRVEPPGGGEPDEAALGESCKARPYTLTGKYPGHFWNVDLTVVPTGLGLWAPWWPFCIAQCWPFAWHLAVIVDHFSRLLVGFALFKKEPSSEQMCRVLDRALQRTGMTPKYTVNDHGPQFSDEYREWCKRRGIKPRFGAIGEHGSIAITERAVRSVKEEGIRPVAALPVGVAAMCRIVSLYVCWYNTCRPHASLGGATPSEIYFGKKPAHEKPRLEPRARYPVKRGEKLCARRGAKLSLEVEYLGGEKHLPVVRLKAA
jgi:transposase InsO family protein